MTMISDEIREWCDFYCDRPIYGCDLNKLHDLADRIDAETVELPKDADGEYIHIGDVMEWYDSGETLTVEGIGRDVLFYIDGENAEWTAARDKHHHHEPTVEDVLIKMLEKAVGYSDAHTTVALNAIVECAAKLRLAGEDE